MNEVRLHIEGLDGFIRRSLEMARRLDQGDREAAESDLSFESMAGLLKVLTPNRWQLLRVLHGRGASSVRALAQALGRDYRGVHTDVATLIDSGLIARDGRGAIHVPWSRITAEMALDTAA